MRTNGICQGKERVALRDLFARYSYLSIHIALRTHVPLGLAEERHVKCVLDIGAAGHFVAGFRKTHTCNSTSVTDGPPEGHHNFGTRDVGDDMGRFCRSKQRSSRAPKTSYNVTATTLFELPRPVTARRPAVQAFSKGRSASL